ncbi:MAG: 16S rRNA (guanine(527)-N(7))-methyltransferase RsmG [Oscillospiraceae bacterium]|nr:16S rRNA (guanine(527)-N(7))-methyltransferase RsmG [Oscillospiraceae bacterium]
MLDFERLKKYAGGYFPGIKDADIEKTALYGELVLERNRAMNLTAISGPEAFVDKHLLDSLAAAALPEIAGEVCDVGSGAGFPGAVIAAVREDARLTLLDSTKKKLEFAAEACAKAEISAKTLHARAEEAARRACRESFDSAVSRAVARLAALCELCLPLVKVGGCFVAMKGPSFEEELREAEGAIAKLGGSFKKTVSYELPDGDRRALIIIEKIQPTPEAYPRAGAKIIKSPLR